MVTFSIPGDNDFVDGGNASPRPRPPLPFAKRAYVSTPYSSKRLGTPQNGSTRRLLTRDDVPSSSLNKVTARNIFKASVTENPAVAPFSPNIPQSTPKKVFAPGAATPEPSRVFRSSTAQATSRGMSAKSTSKDLFHQRIEDPDPELSGQVLSEKIPKDWSSKTSIYADQYLAHLCPPEFDDEQRRQFFCILDLRRLKYAANEIFANKDWKLNIINFAKEFEKSRSIILLRYGLYEFQNVKPSKEVLKRWRREHGLPDPDEEDDEEDVATGPSPSAAQSVKKRKAEDDGSQDTVMSNVPVNKNKRRAPEVAEEEEEEEEETVVASTPSFVKTKRKASMGGEGSQPSKLQRSTPSAAKTLFEKIANKASTTPVGSPTKSAAAAAKPAEESVTTKPNPFASNKANGSLQRSVFQNPKPTNPQSTPNGGSNIFGYLSDASSAKNSGVDADAESETDSEAEDSPEAGQSDEPSAAETGSQAGSSLFASKPAPTSSLGLNGSSAPGSRETTPARSLFDRVTKNSEGQPVRAETNGEPTAAKPAISLDQTWNPTTTPIKFAPPAPASQPATSSLFGNNANNSGASTPASSIFAPKSTAPSNIFGANQDKPAEKPAPVAHEKDQGDESDKENDSVPKKSPFEPKPTSTPSFGTSSLFQPKPAEAPKEAEPAKPAMGLFGTPSKTEDKPAAAPASSIFGAKPAEPVKPVMQSSTLFGAKAAEAEKPAAEPTKSLFGGASTEAPTSNIFGAKPVATTSNIFGNSGSAATPSLFGAASSAPKTDSAPAATPTFTFGAHSTNGDKPNGTNGSLFGAPKSPTLSAPTNNLFGSPMKQDNPSPAKKPFPGIGVTSEPAPIFKGFTPSGNTSSSSNIFGNASAATNGTSSSSPGNIFGNASAATNGTSTSAPIFGNATTTTTAAAPSNTGSGGFNFSFSSDTAAPSTSFSNPFSGGVDNSGGSASFTFGSAPDAPAGSSTPFHFGGGSAAPAPASTISFGGNSGNTATSGAPGFSFTSASPAPQPSASFTFGAGSQPAPSFGSSLQPPVGGASTTGTNSPFSLGGSSLATTPAGGTPEPSAQTAQTAQTNGGDNEEVEKHEQISLTGGAEEDEENIHEVRAKVLKFVPAGEKSAGGEEKSKSKSPWSTQGVGPLRLLKHKETNAVRLLLRAEPRGNVAMNRAVLPDMSYKSDEKYVKMTTSNEKGDGLETWMIQVKTKDLAKELAEALEKHKELNKK